MKHSTFPRQSDAVCVGARVWVCVGVCVNVCDANTALAYRTLLHHLELSTFVTWDMGGKPLCMTHVCILGNN